MRTYHMTSALALKLFFLYLLSRPRPIRPEGGAEIALMDG